MTISSARWWIPPAEKLLWSHRSPMLYTNALGDPFMMCSGELTARSDGNVVINESEEVYDER